MNLILIVLALSTLQACASYPTKIEYEELLKDSPITRQDFSEFPYEILRMNKKVKFELGSDLEVADFGEGKTFFKAFELPDGLPLNMLLKVRSGFNTVAQARGHVPYPKMLLLDANYQTIFEKHSEMVQKHAASGNVEFEDVMPVEENARYVVIFTSPDTINGSIQWRYGLFVPVGSGFLDHQSKKGAKIGVGGPMNVRLYIAE